MSSAIAKAARDPVWFAENVVGVKLWRKSREILAAIDKPGARVAIKGSHRSSKTHTLGAVVVPWFVANGGTVITTAPTGDQVDLMWSEIRAAHERAVFPLGGDMLTTEWKLGRQTLAIGRSTDKAERIQGKNQGERILIVVDEAPGVRPGIFEGIEGIASGGDVRVVMLGNPTLLGGAFYDAFNREREAWNGITISAFDSPNLEGYTLDTIMDADEADLEASAGDWPFLCRGKWVREKLIAWGPEDSRFESRVLGRFPSQNDMNMFHIGFIEKARDRTVNEDGEELRRAPLYTAGIDPAAGGGDEMVLYLRKGAFVSEVESWTDKSSWDGLIGSLGRHGGPAAFDKVNVDANGIGYGLVRELEQIGYPVVGITAQATACDRARFDKRKDEMYSQLRELLEEGQISGIVDDTTISQLTQIRWSLGAMGRMVVEGKRELKARGVRSPDRAEALMLCFATEPKSYGVRTILV